MPRTRVKTKRSKVGLSGNGRIDWNGNMINAVSLHLALKGLSADTIAGYLKENFGVSLTRGQIYRRVWSQEHKMGDYRRGISPYSIIAMEGVKVVDGGLPNKKQKQEFLSYVVV